LVVRVAARNGVARIELGRALGCSGLNVEQQRSEQRKRRKTVLVEPQTAHRTSLRSGEKAGPLWRPDYMFTRTIRLTWNDQLLTKLMVSLMNMAFFYVFEALRYSGIGSTAAA
jgi:hypothetical protein